MKKLSKEKKPQRREILAGDPRELQGQGMYQDLFQLAPVGYCTLTVEGLILEANLTITTLLGVPKSKLVNCPFSSFILKANQDVFYLNKDRLFKTGKSQSFDLQIVQNEGTSFWANLVIALKNINERSLIYLTLTNVEDRKQMELTLAFTAEQLARTGRIAKIGGWHLDLQTKNLFWSEETCRIHEVDPPVAPRLEEAIGFYAPEAQETIRDLVQAGIDHGTDWDVELPLITANGRRIWVRAQGSAVMKEGKVVELLGTFQDITERRTLETQLRQAQKMETIGRLAGGIAHDFNNMLTVILGHVEMALPSLAPSDPIHGAFLEIGQAAERSAELTRQLLAFSRQQIVAPKVLSLNNFVNETIQMVKRLIGPNITLIWNPAEDLKLVKIDPSQVHQIITNLCVNARDAISENGTITIETGNHQVTPSKFEGSMDLPLGDYVRLSVRDDGCGMSPEICAHIFEPFYTTKEVNSGTGLGLAMVYGIVKQNDGSIRVSSRLGEGTTFQIDLPAYDGAMDPSLPEAESKVKFQGRETLLIIEDELLLLDMTQRMLESKGYTVLTASSPSEALRVVEVHGEKIDLLLTDVQMPEMNGCEFSKLLQSRYPHLCSLFMSGFTAKGLTLDWTLNEGIEFIEKPFTINGLSEKVRQILDQSTKSEESKKTVPSHFRGNKEIS